MGIYRPLPNTVRTNTELSVQKYPLLWIYKNYFATYKANTFIVPSTVGSFVYAGNAADYAKVTEIDLADQDLTTDFTDAMLGEFVNLVNLFLQGNNITVLYLDALGSLERLDVSRNTALQITNFLSLENLVTFQANDCNLPSLIVPSSLVNFAAVRNNYNYINLSNNSALKSLYIHSNPITPDNLLQIATDLNTANVTGAYIEMCHIFNGLMFINFTAPLTNIGITLNSVINIGTNNFEINIPSIRKLFLEGGMLLTGNDYNTGIYIENSAIKIMGRVFSPTAFNFSFDLNFPWAVNENISLKITRVGNLFSVFKNGVLISSLNYTTCIVNVNIAKIGMQRSDGLRLAGNFLIGDSGMTIKNTTTNVTHTYLFQEVTENNSLLNFTTDGITIIDSTGGIDGEKNTLLQRRRVASNALKEQAAILATKGNTILFNHTIF